MCSGRRHQPIVGPLRRLTAPSLADRRQLRGRHRRARGRPIRGRPDPGPPNALAGARPDGAMTAPPERGSRDSPLQYFLGQFSSGEWLPFIRTAEGALLESCVPPGGQTICERGAATTVRSARQPFSHRYLGIEAGVRCASRRACVNGASLHAAWTAIYSTRVQITDPSPPTLRAPSGALWANGYHRGVEGLSVQASDNTGSPGDALAGGRVRARRRGAPCDFTYVIPCTNEPGAAIGLDTRAIPTEPTS